MRIHMTVGLFAALMVAALAGFFAAAATLRMDFPGRADAGVNNDVAANVIAGFSGNAADASVAGAVIGGGGRRAFPNLVAGDFGTVGGGEGNAVGSLATVAGGSSNRAGGIRAAIGGGSNNQALADHATIGGGTNNTAAATRTTIGGGSGNTASRLDATVSGGSGNTAAFAHATVGGGTANIAGSLDTTVSGGSGNIAGGAYATIGGGSNNRAAGFGASVGGGSGNIAAGGNATAGGGLGNRVSDNYATVAGGLGNRAGTENQNGRDAQYAAVGGGMDNAAQGLASTVAGGSENTAGGAFAAIPGGRGIRAASDYSFAAGRRAHVAAAHPGAFVFADSNNFDFVSIGANEFAVRATGGVRLITAVDAHGQPQAGVRLAAGSGSWASLSDRNAKENLRPADAPGVLRQLANLPIYTWNYRAQAASNRHIGPTAQDFQSAFAVGSAEGDGYIATVDADGVALAAIQGLWQLLNAKDRQIGALQDQIAALQALNRQQSERVAGLEARMLSLEDNLEAGRVRF